MESDNKNILGGMSLFPRLLVKKNCEETIKTLNKLRNEHRRGYIKKRIKNYRTLKEKWYSRLDLPKKIDILYLLRTARYYADSASKEHFKNVKIILDLCKQSKEEYVYLSGEDFKWIIWDHKNI